MAQQNSVFNTSAFNTTCFNTNYQLSSGGYTPTYFQPNNLSGIFLWFKSTGNSSNNQLSLPSGATITYWQDNSGSGNNLTPAISSTAYFPTYNPNALNGYPSIKFNGSSQYLTVGNNPTLNLAGSSLVIFTVYKSNDAYTQVNVCNNDNSNTTSADNGFLIGLNNPGISGWYFGWGPMSGHGDPKELAAVSTNPNVGSNLNQPGQFVLRMDGWQAESGNFAFGQYGAIICTGVASMDISASNAFSVGYSNSIGSYFNGEVVEILAYNRPMYISEINQVNNYFIQKYQFGNAKSCSLYINGSSGVQGSYASSTIPLYLNNNNWASGYTPLYLSNGLYASSTLPLYVGSSTHASGQTSLFSWGKLSCASGFTLFTLATNHISGHTSLFVDGGGHASGSQPLYVSASYLGYSGVKLYLNNYTNISGGVSLYLSNGVTTGSYISIYTTGIYRINHSTTLYTACQHDYNNIPSFTWGNAYISGGNPLFIHGKSSGLQPFALFTQGGLGYSTLNNSSPLFAQSSNAGTSGIYNSTSLYTYAIGGANNLPLYLAATPINTNPSNSMTAFISGPVNTGTCGIGTSLYLYNSAAIAQSTRVKCFIAGLGQMNGASIAGNSFSLYINRLPGNYSPMFIHGGNYPTGSTSLFTRSANFTNGGSVLYLSGCGTSGGMPLYMSGPNRNGSGINMFIAGYPEISQGINAYVRGF